MTVFDPTRTLGRALKERGSCASEDEKVTPEHKVALLIATANKPIDDNLIEPPSPICNYLCMRWQPRDLGM